MKVLSKMIVIVLIALLITGCAPNAPVATGNEPIAGSNPMPTDNAPIPTDTAPSNLKYSTIHMEWVYHHTLDELMQFATNVFEGKLTKITFGTASYTGLHSGDTYTDLYTIYEFEVSNSYKGKNAGTVRVGIPGGMEGYKVSEQYNVMAHAGIYHEKIGIPLLDGHTHLPIGESYLIIGIDLGNGFLDVPNPTRFIYSANRSNQDSYFGYQEIKDYFSKS